MMLPNFFSSGSPYLNHPLLTPERTALEIDFILSQIDLPEGGSVLDVGCGYGRHSIELALRGYDVIGIDSSSTMIEEALSLAIKAGVTPLFQRIRGEDFLVAEMYDAAICLFTTLGQIDYKADNSPMLSRIAQALHPGSSFVLEVPRRDLVAKNLRSFDRFGEGEYYTEVKRQFNARDNTVTEEFSLFSPQGTRTYLLRYRLYNDQELKDMLKRTNFEVLATFGGYAQIPSNKDSPIIVLFSQKN